MIYEGSRYAKGYLLKDGEEYYLAPETSTYEPQKTDLVYQFREGDRLDLLAKKFYDNASYKWLILQANPKYFSELDIKHGDIIIIPNPKEVEIYVNASI